MNDVAADVRQPEIATLVSVRELTPTALTRPGEMGPTGLRKNSTAAEGKD